MKKPPNSVIYNLYTLRPLCYQLMVMELGKSPYWCEGCHTIQEQECEIHHTKYKDATLYDLRFFCSKCQHQPEHKGLA
jgi:hypothetical protein